MVIRSLGSSYIYIYIYLCAYIRTSLDTYRLKRVLLRLKTERKSVTIDL
jgi:hypothetical protein